MMSVTYFNRFGCAFLLAALSMLFASCNGENRASTTATQDSLFANAPASPISLANGPSNVVVGDMNSDRKLDLVVAFGRTRTIVVLPGKGDGQFGAAVSETTVKDSPGEIAGGDVNRDGNLDVAISSHDSYGVMLLLGNGRGGLTVAPTSPVLMRLGQQPHTHGLAIADMNHDDKLDLVTTNNNDNDISIALGDGRGNFTRAPQSPFPVGPSPYPFAVGDVNNDGWMDVAATASATGPSRRQQLPLSRALTLLLSDGKGGLAARQLPLRTGEPWFAAIGDLNGDGKADIVASHHELNALTVLIGNGRGEFVEGPGSPFDFGVSLFHIVIADVNRDGKKDVIGASGDSIRVLLSDGSGVLKSTTPVTVGRGAYRLAVADLNGDGRTDVVTSNSESNSVSVLLGR
jgi:hypothetical protein